MSDIGREATKAWNRVLPTSKILVGAGFGWFTGYMTLKHGKSMAVGVGGGIILMQLALTEGHINSDTCMMGSSFLGGLLVGMSLS